MKTQHEHFTRINKVKKYIDDNISEKLPLSELATIAYLSPFHFQRIFKSIEAETPKQYIQRRRLEAAAHHIVLKIGSSMLEVAMQYGFGSLQSFSRAFKNHYNYSPDKFRRKSEEEKIHILQSKIITQGKQSINSNYFILQKNEIQKDLQVNVVKLPPKKLVYILLTLKDIDTVINGYKKIRKWAAAHNLFSPSTELLGLLNDYPAFTPLEKCRFYTCISVESKVDIINEMQYMEIPSRMYATFEISGGINALIKAVTQFASEWLPDSGYEINHVPAIIKPLQDPIRNHPHQISYQVFLALKPIK